jgi:hemophore-related protein
MWHFTFDDAATGPVVVSRQPAVSQKHASSLSGSYHPRHLRNIRRGRCGYRRRRRWFGVGECGRGTDQAADGGSAAQLHRRRPGPCSIRCFVCHVDYMFTHPDVNAFFTGLKGQDRGVMRDNAQNYLNANPQVQADLQGIRQPLVDFKARCQ